MRWRERVSETERDRGRGREIVTREQKIGKKKGEKENGALSVFTIQRCAFYSGSISPDHNPLTDREIN